MAIKDRIDGGMSRSSKKSALGWALSSGRARELSDLSCSRSLSH